MVLLEATWDFGREGTAPFSLCEQTIDNPELSDSFNASKVTSLPSNMGHGEEERQNKTKHTSSIIIYVHLSSFIIIYHHLSIIHHRMPLLTACLTALLIPPIEQLPPDLLRFVERPVTSLRDFTTRSASWWKKNKQRCSEISPMHVYNCIHNFHVCVCARYMRLDAPYLSSGWEEWEEWDQ